MTRSRLATINLPLFLLAAAVVALLAFGATRWIADSRTTTLPDLAIEGDRAAAAPGALDVTEVVTARQDTVVAIEATIAGEPMNGTGVVVGTDGTIVTASHVVKDYDTATDASIVVVRFHAGDEVQAQVVALDQLSDLAILKVDPAEVTELRAAPLADSDQVLVGTPVVAIGNPLGYRWTTTTGHVSNPHVVLGSRINGNSDIPDAVQHDSAINTGNSGGPLFNARGQVIGITQQIATRNGGSVGLSFSVASNLVRRAIEQQAASGESLIAYADLGLGGDRTVDLSPQLAKAAGIDATHGAMIQRAEGPAAAARLGSGQTITHLGRLVKVGDVIVELGGQPVRSSSDLARLTGYLDPTAPVEAVVVRGSERLTVTLRPDPRVL